MQQQKEKIVEALKNCQVLIKELENYTGPTSHHNRHWIDELTTKIGNVKNDLFRIDEKYN
jgi:hypothetical protein